MAVDTVEDSIEVQVPSNIALIKYWGKRNEDLILPLNDSISLSIDCIHAKTRIAVGLFGSDSVTINGKSVDLAKSQRFVRCFNEARRLTRKRKNGSDHGGLTYFKVESVTNFPVAAGLASSAAGFAAIAVGISKLCGYDEKETSRIARIGSGSACRSVLDGLVRWRAGEKECGSDCFAERVFPSSHWSQLRAIIIVLNEEEKDIGSTKGMQVTVKTSELLTHRVKELPKRIDRLISAFSLRDFASLGEEIMRDSNQFHAVCADTWPPLRYMSDASFSVVKMVNSFNANGIKAAYTFDAGPNACIYMEKENVVPFLKSIADSISIPEKVQKKVMECNAEFSEELKDWNPTRSADISASDLILSTVGGGPIIFESLKR